MSDKRLRVLVLARSYPNDVLATLGLWIEQPTVRLAHRCDMQVISPVPWCPPLPAAARLEHYRRFRAVAVTDRRHGVEIAHPRFVVGPGNSTYALEAWSYAAGVARTVAGLQRNRPFDLVHAHFIYPEGAVALRLSRRYGVPFVVTEHAPWTGWLDRPGVARQALPAARAAAAIMPVSTSVRETVHAYAGDAVRTEVIPIGVDPDAFFPRAEADRRPDQILFVGLINYNKGIDVLLEAMALLKERDLPGRLLLAGDGFYRNTRLQGDRLRRQAVELGLGERVTFLGRRSPEEVARLMAESAVVVLPSRAESFGAVLVEALACGTPVVATRCGGPEDVVTEDVGELVPVGDVEALAAALTRVLAGQGRYDRSELRRVAIERFGWDAIADRIHAVYREATG